MVEGRVRPGECGLRETGQRRGAQGSTHGARAAVRGMLRCGCGHGWQGEGGAGMGVGEERRLARGRITRADRARNYRQDVMACGGGETRGPKKKLAIRNEPVQIQRFLGAPLSQ